MSHPQDEQALYHCVCGEWHEKGFMPPCRAMTGQTPRTRGTSNSNARGNSRDRAARRRWLVQAWRANEDVYTTVTVDSVGDGVPACRCYRCGCLLTEDSVTVDRIVPGCKGGRYVRGNIRPACAGCNSETGGGLRR